jgi:hypothetical protein
MIFMTLQFAGVVGKSTIAEYVLKPRVSQAAFIAVESINSSASDLSAEEIQKFRGEQIVKILDSIEFADGNAIVDIGSSNVEAFLKKLPDHPDIFESVHRYIVPVTPDKKVQKDALRTVDALSALGIERSKIILLPNHIKESVKDDFSAEFLKQVSSEKKARINDSMFIKHREIFEFLFEFGGTLEELRENRMAYKDKARALKAADPDSTDADLFMSMGTHGGTASVVIPELDRIFAYLVGA